MNGEFKCLYDGGPSAAIGIVQVYADLIHARIRLLYIVKTQSDVIFIAPVIHDRHSGPVRAWVSTVAAQVAADVVGDCLAAQLTQDHQSDALLDTAGSPVPVLHAGVKVDVVSSLSGEWYHATACTCRINGSLHLGGSRTGIEICLTCVVNMCIIIQHYDHISVRACMHACIWSLGVHISQ